MCGGKHMLCAREKIPSPTSNSTYLSMNASSREMPNANVSNFRGSMGNSIMRPNSSSTSKFSSSMSYPQMKPKSPHNSGLVNLTERSRYGMSDMTNSSADLDTNSMLNDSSSDEDLNEVDSENGLSVLDRSKLQVEGKESRIKNHRHFPTTIPNTQILSWSKSSLLFSNGDMHRYYK